MTTSQQRIFLGADHGGYALKEHLKADLTDRGYEVVDSGTHSEDAVDYPSIAREVAGRVRSEGSPGILVCGSGNGMAIVANKVPGVRAANTRDPEETHLARAHNDINVLTLAGRRLSPEQAIEIVTEFLSTPFAGGRHQRRVQQIEELDKSKPEAV